MTIIQKLYFSHRIESWKERLRSVFGRWPTLMRFYGRVEYVLGMICLKRRRPFCAVGHFCNVVRRGEAGSSAHEQSRSQLKIFLGDDGAGGSLEDFRKTPYASALRARFFSQPFPLNVTIRGNLLPLKCYDPHSGEKGVLVLKYNYVFQAFHAILETERLREFYSIVLEPSYHHFTDPAYSLFNGWHFVLEARNPVLNTELQEFAPKTETVPLNSGDWVDPDTFYPMPDSQKQYDLILVGNWSRNKRHELLFRTLAKIRRPLRVALVGFPWERTQNDVVTEMRKFGVAGQCEIFERVPAEIVNRLLNQSRVNLMLSKVELANKALYEAMFANVPSLIYRLCEGVDMSYVNDQTGLLVDDDELGDAILTVLDQPGRFAPREWALQHTGYLKSTQILNQKLRDLSLERGEGWTTDIAPKVNCPDLAYKREEDASRLLPEMHRLANYLRRNQGA